MSPVTRRARRIFCDVQGTRHRRLYERKRTIRQHNEESAVLDVRLYSYRQYIVVVYQVHYCSRFQGNINSKMYYLYLYLKHGSSTITLSPSILLYCCIAPVQQYVRRVCSASEVLVLQEYMHYTTRVLFTQLKPYQVYPTGIRQAPLCP